MVRIFERTEPRSSRDAFAELSPPSAIQQFTVEHVIGNSAVHALLVTVATLIEMFVVVLYFVATESSVSPAGFTRTLTSYPMPSFIATWLGFAGIYGVLASVVWFVLAPDRIGQLKSFSSMVSLGTGICMIVSMATYSNSTGTSLLPPVFLRCWILYRYTKTVMFASDRISKPVQAIIVQMVFLLCIIVTCVGLSQITFSLETNSAVTFDTMLYFVIVTLCTIGYGDVAPESYYGRVLVILMIFLAMVLLPVLTNDVTEAAVYFESQRGYDDTANHVIIVGEFTIEAVEFIFQELLHPDRKFAGVHLVFVSPTEYDENIRTLASSYHLKDRVTLCIGSPRQADDLLRFSPRRADAVFFYSNPNAPSSRGDFRIIQLAILMRRTDPFLPQYFMLKHSTHAHILQRSAFVVFDREALVYAIAGLALKFVGFSTMFFNLVRPTQILQSYPNTPESLADWVSLYQYGAQQSLFSVPVPQHMDGRNFSTVGVMFQVRAAVTIVALVRNGTAIVNPAMVKLLLTDRLVVIAPSLDYATQRLQNFSSSTGNMDPPTAMTTLTFGTGLTERRVNSSRRQHCYPFKNHVVVLDVSNARAAPPRCDEEERDAENHRAERIASLADYFKDKRQGFLLVSMTAPSVAEIECWRAMDRQPIYHVNGSALDSHVLDMCCIPDAAGVLIVALDEGDRSPLLRSTQVAAQRLVFQRVQGRPVSVVMVVDDCAEMRVMEPKNVSADDDPIDRTQSFCVGGVFSHTMVDSLVFRTYFNQYLPQVIEQLLEPGRIAMDAITNYVPVGLLATQKSIYSHLCRTFGGDMKVIIGISRVIDKAANPMAIGRRCFLTNPPGSMPLRKDDMLMYITPDTRYR